MINYEWTQFVLFLTQVVPPIKLTGLEKKQNKVLVMSDNWWSFYTLNHSYISLFIEFKSPEDLTPEESKSKILDPVTKAFLREIFEIFFFLQMDTISNMYAGNVKEDPLPNIEELDSKENVPKLSSHGRHGRRKRSH